MTATAAIEKRNIRIERADPNAAILICGGRTDVAIKGGTAVDIDDIRYVFEQETPVAFTDPVPGSDYNVVIGMDGKPYAERHDADVPYAGDCIGGFHFAPGGCAEARAGGDTVPAINPHSLWDLDFRPACPDPRGMALVSMADGRRLWVDIYLLGTGQGTSRHGAEIADGDSLDVLDHKTAVAIYAHHGKRLLTYDEFRTAAYGVTERSSADRDPRKTGLDAARTSRFGLMQATGNLWIWGTDGDPDDPRPSLFGGSWFLGSLAGSRYAILVFHPEGSDDFISARGACDHLNPA